MTVPKNLRKDNVVVHLRPRRDIDGELERVNELRKELAEPAEEIADGHLWAERCREAIRDALDAKETG